MDVFSGTSHIFQEDTQPVKIKLTHIPKNAWKVCHFDQSSIFQSAHILDLSEKIR